MQSMNEAEPLEVACWFDKSRSILPPRRLFECGRFSVSASTR